MRCTQHLSAEAAAKKRGYLLRFPAKSVITAGLGFGPRREGQYEDFTGIRVLSPARAYFINFSD